MSTTLRHRGPDDSGSFTDGVTGVALGSRRLAIIDLSCAGHQPMTSSDGRFVLAYNGEIYNFLELRRELEGDGLSFRGSSDTEVLLASIQKWGFEPALKRCHGMFALALWDRASRRLSLARDRFGEKPLYFGWSNGVFLFGSELKALRAHTAFGNEIDRDSLVLYLRHNCVPAPYCIYRGIFQLSPGTTLTIEDSTPPGTVPSPESYWRLRDVAEAGEPARAHKRDERGGSDVEETLDELDEVLRNAVAMRMHSDVPFGAFLSGGVDSSLVVSLMQACGGSKTRTFTISSEDSAYDESAEARKVAEHLGTEHVEMLVTAQDALSVIPSLATMYDEPFGDSSQIPTALLAKLTRDHVTVALSGDGGDELFGGYNRYMWAKRFWWRADRVPRRIRHLAGATLVAVPPRWWDVAWARTAPLLPRDLRIRNLGTKLQKVARVLPAASLSETYWILASHFDKPGQIVIGATEPGTRLTDRESWPRSCRPEETMMYLDSMTYLPDDILTKVDRATMASSLESRLPFLDQEVAELSWRLPLSYKLRGSTGKWALRQLLYRYVPASLVDRPKAGFGVPLETWLKGQLRPWAEELLDPVRLRREGFLNPEPIRALWKRHLDGRVEAAQALWTVLMFEAWLDRWA